MLALLAVTAEFAALKPWQDMVDSDVVGLTDPVTGDTRLACILGNAGEVFGAAFYRRQTGVRWLVNVLTGHADCMRMDEAASMDALQVQLVPKREMRKEDLSRLKSLDFKPAGTGPVWPQFQSMQPGWHPWFIDQTEAEQLLADVPRLTRFAVLFRRHPDLFDNHLPGQFPFLPNPMPSRPLLLEDLNWRPIILQPEASHPFRPADEQLRHLRALKYEGRTAYEFGSRVVSGGAVLERGRRSYSRLSLLMEHQRGVVLGFDLSLAGKPLMEAAGSALIKTLLAVGSLPGTLWIDDNRLEPILGPLCQQLNVKLQLSKKLNCLADAEASLESFMQGGPL